MIDDERDFWANEPTRSIPLIGGRDKGPATTRQRRHSAAASVDPRPAGGGSRRPSDPFLRRLGVMVAAVLVTIPVAATLRDGGASEIVRSSVSAESGLVPADGSSSSDLASSSAALDPSTELAAVTLAPTTTDADTSTIETVATTVESTVEPTVETTVAVTTVAVTAAPDTAPPATALPAAPAPVTAAPTVAKAAVVTTAAAPATTQEVHVAAAPTCTTGYDIVPGDYWILIADKIDVTTAELFAANGAGPDTPLYAGRTICVPAGASPTTTTDAPATTQAPAAKTTTTTAAPKVTTTTAAPKVTTTTAAPKATTTTAAPEPTIPARSYSAAEVDQIIRDVWPDDLEDEAVRIATRESNLHPTARNACCYGLFQIYYSVHKAWLGQMGVTSASQLLDPRINATAALQLYYRSGGFGPWN